MLTCEICGEDILLEEDMKTHLLLSHLENSMSCPLCSLSAVSYDDLCLHISCAHPDEQYSTQTVTSSSIGSVTQTENPQTSPFLIGNNSNSPDGAIPDIGSGVNMDSSKSKQNSTYGGKASSSGKATCRLKTTQQPGRHCKNDDRIQSGDKKAKWMSSSKEEQLFPCPLCALVCSSSFVLQEHVELHLQEQHSAEGKDLDLDQATQTRSMNTSAASRGSVQGVCSPVWTSPSASSRSGEERLECPVCFAVCSDSFTLQEHVEQHLDQDTVSPNSDLELAIQLQQEEEQQRRRKEAQQERQEFKKLQRQFGLDNRGGYSKQMERSMERAVARGLMGPLEFHCKRAEMMESLASGVDDGTTRTRGVIRALCEYYQAEGRACAHVWLSCDTDHYCCSAGDKGWGCGYRNFQMLLSSLHTIDTYSTCLQEKVVPSIPRVQCMIEEAWKEGLDPQGASHFSQKLQGTRAWIGATEIFSLLTSLGIDARIIDFHQPTGPGGTHPRLFEWVKQYFSQSSTSGKVLPRLIQTALPPLYLQHQGHSCSIVGLEQRKSEQLCLLVLDPGSSVSHTRKLLGTDISHIRRFPYSLKHKQYQVVAVQGRLSAEDKQISILNSQTLRAERIP